MCPHERRIDDFGTGTEVCLDCGMVVTENIFGQDVPNSFSPERAASLMVREYLLDALAVAHVDNGFIVNQTVDNLTKFGFLSRGESPDKLLGTSRGRGILAFTLWETMNQCESPRSPREIAFLLHSTTSEMQKVEREFRISPSFIPPSHYVQRACQELYLPFALTCAIKSIVEQLDHLMQKPETVVGGILLTVREHINKGSPLADCIPLLSIINLCEVLNVSSTAIYNMKRTHISSEIVSLIIENLRRLERIQMSDRLSRHRQKPVKRQDDAVSH